MAEKDDAAAQDDAGAGKSGGGGVLPWIAVGVVASGIGAAVPVGMSMLAAPPAAEPQKSAPFDTTPATSAMMFHSFGEITVNLDEGRMNRYLRLKIVLHIRKSDEQLVVAALKENNLILRNWLLSHLSDKELDDIRGKAGQNMLRREIRDHFNSVLFTDNYERIYDVLFEEFNVQ